MSLTSQANVRLCLSWTSGGGGQSASKQGRNGDQKGLCSNPSLLAVPLAKLIEAMGTILPTPEYYMREKATAVVVRQKS